MDPSNFERLTAGDPGAFTDLYDRYARLVRSICFDTTKNLAQADDLAQEVFLRAYQRIGQLRRPDALGGWLAAIARRACRDWQRQRGRDRHRYVEDLPDREAGEPEGYGQEEIDTLRTAIGELPEKERMALHIHYLCEQPAEVAREILGLSSSGFYKLIDRARRRLAAIMQPRSAEP